MHTEDKIMLTVKGKIENGKILALESVDDYEGKEVIITLAENRETANTKGWENLFTVLEENKTDAEISDLVLPLLLDNKDSYQKTFER